ncbi:MAG TPA: ParA family protein [Candidatus Pullichristensenella excrementigallinarum]|uniref:Sporulation initiation inhibitor protein Soj n=1 Tax=Candidatus Pullichristensenella excrementigallinarum TaxID=2840907 RepID=A0A9D1LAJ5_9FIRM|nr:ParA family protein [Candidatus Pullichristensenella excrementigallinarum]
MAKIIAVTNQKGGVGKTTTSVNLSGCVAEAGRKVLLIDIDPQGNATSGLGVTGEGPTVYEVLLGDGKVEDAVRNTGFDDLDLIPAGIELAGAEIELVGVEKRENLLKDALETLRDRYDYIFIDCPPSLGLLTLNALTAADSVLVPIQCEYYALEGVGQLMNTIKLVRRKLNPDLEVEGIVLTMFDARTNLGAQVVEEVRAHFSKEAFETMIPRNVRLSEAPSYGIPIHRYDARCPGAQAYRALAKELIGRNERK